MKPCIGYAFGYVSSRPRPDEPLPIAILHQRSLMSAFAKSNDYKPDGWLVVVRLTNRKRHFADTPEFRSAVVRAKELGCPVIIGDLKDMLERTPADLIDDCGSAILASGIPIVDARAGEPIKPEHMEVLKLLAKQVSVRRSSSIRHGLARTHPRDQSASSNQALAVKGAVVGADKWAESLGPVVQSIQSNLQPDKDLTPTVLARELNAKGVPSARGKAWSPNSAKNLLDRLKLR